MTNPNNHQGVRITRVDKQRSPESVRRLGKALIALARAQLEADAEADVAQLDKKIVPIAPKNSKARSDSGDAA